MADDEVVGWLVGCWMWLWWYLVVLGNGTSWWKKTKLKSNLAQVGSWLKRSWSADWYTLHIHEHEHAMELLLLMPWDAVLVSWWLVLLMAGVCRFVAWRVCFEDEQGTRRQVATQPQLKDAIRRPWMRDDLMSMCVCCVECRVGAVAGYFGAAAGETLLEMMLIEFRPEIHADILRGCSRVLQLQLQWQ